MNAIVPIPPGASLPAALAPDLTRAAEWAREEKAAATRRAYRSDFAGRTRFKPPPISENYVTRSFACFGARPITASRAPLVRPRGSWRQIGKNTVYGQSL